MTKLMQWVSVAAVLAGAWTAIVTTPQLEDYAHIIVPAPIILVLLFGLYAVAVVLWRVFTFNNCTEAAEELQKEISEAREDLRTKGLKLND